MFHLLLPLVAFAATTVAQTWTSCNPLNSTCPDNPALGTTFTEVFNGSVSEFDTRYWNITAGTDLISFSDELGASLAILNEGQSVTLQSNFYIFFGTMEIIFQSAPGTGIISTAILLSDDLDEIDWEIKGGNSTTVENNWYGWGNTTQINSEYPGLDGAQTNFVNYTVDWTQDRIEYSLNGQVVRTVGYAEPGQYPQTPSRVQFGLWCGGCSSQPGTVQWAGGKPDWSQAPYQMNIKSIRVVDGHQNASTYSYSDHSGSYQSIAVTSGQSDAYKAINDLSTVQSAEQHWQGLSSGAKIGIAVGVLGAVAIFMIGFCFYIAKQRKAGRLEAEAHEKEWQAQNAELMEYRSMMGKGGFAMSRQSILVGDGMENGLPARPPKGRSALSRLSGRF